MTTKLTAYTCGWCHCRIRTTWRSQQQPLDKCPMCGRVAVQEGLPEANEPNHYGQEEATNEPT